MLKNIEQNLTANKTKYYLCYILILVTILGCAQTTEKNKSKKYEEVYVLLNAKYITNGKITREENYKYNKDGKKTSYEVKLDNGRLFEFEHLEYDKEGKLKTVNATGGIKIEYEYNKFGKIKLFKETNKDGHIYLKKKIKYDNRGNPIESQEIDGYAKTGKWEKIKYDNLGRVIDQSEGVENKVTFSESYNYTNDGKKLTIESCNSGENINYMYDDKGRNIKIVEIGKDKKEKVTKYNYNGDLLDKVIFPNGNSDKYEYQCINGKMYQANKLSVNKTGEIIKNIKYVYEEISGKIFITKIIVTNKIGDETGDNTIFYRDKNGNEIYCEEYENGKIKKKVKKEYYKNEKIKQEEKYDYFLNSSKIEHHYIKKYDKEGKKIEEYIYDAPNKFYEKYEIHCYYFYDMAGNIIKEYYDSNNYTTYQYIKIKRLKGDEVK